MKNKKGNVAIIAVIIVIVAITVAVVTWIVAKRTQTITVQPVVTQPVANQPVQVDETAGWQTYISSKYGFELKYPTDLVLMPEQINTNAVNFSKNGKGVLGVAYYRDIEDVSYTSSVAPKTFADLEKDPQYSNVQTKKFLGYDAFSYTFTNEVINLTENGLFVNKDGIIYDISYNNEITSIGKNVLSTFKFTNPIANEAAGWQTYTNTKYGFSFKYPGTSKFSTVDESSGDKSVGSFGAIIIRFYLPTTDPNWTDRASEGFAALTATILTKEKASELNAACSNPEIDYPMVLPCHNGKIDGKPAAENDKYVFYLSNFNQDGPVDAINVDQLNVIISTFQLTK